MPGKGLPWKVRQAFRQPTMWTILTTFAWLWKGLSELILEGTGLRETIWIDGQCDDGLESHTWNNSNSLWLWLSAQVSCPHLHNPCRTRERIEWGIGMTKDHRVRGVRHWRFSNSRAAYPAVTCHRSRQIKDTSRTLKFSGQKKLRSYQTRSRNTLENTEA